MGLFNRGKKTIELQAICQGEVKDIIEASDAVFSQKMMGDGVMVIPKAGISMRHVMPLSLWYFQPNMLWV